MARIAQRGGMTVYTMKSIPVMPVTFFKRLIPLITVFMLSLIIPPAIGINFDALYLRLFMARLSALVPSMLFNDTMPVNTVKLIPMPHRQNDFIKEVMPVRLILLQMVFAALMAYITLMHGRITETEISSITVTVSIIEVFVAAAVIVLPEDACITELMGTKASMYAHILDK